MSFVAKALKVALPSDLKYWNRYAPVLGVLRHSRIYNALVDQVNEQLHLRPGDRVLELGSGTGNWLLRSHMQVREVVGLEFSPAMIVKAEQNLREAGVTNVTLRQWDLNQGLPPDLGQFDKVVSVATHGYLRSRQQLTDQVAQHLLPGGIFVTATPRAGADFFGVLKAEFRESWQTDSFSGFVLKFLTKLPLGLIAAVYFGGIIQIKAKIGECHFYKAGELEAEKQKPGLEVLYSEPGFVGMYSVVAVRKPLV